MAGRGSGPDFVEALARGLDVLACFGADRPTMTLSEVATAAGLARPTARRLLLTLEELGFVRTAGNGFSLTPKVLTLGMAYVGALGLWDIARPHLERLVAQTGESSSMAQLDGSDIVYVARVAVPKLIALRVEIGTRFPAAQTSQGKVLLAALSPAELDAVLAQPSRAGLPPYIGSSAEQLHSELTEVRARGWALADEELAPGVRSVAVPVRDGSGAVRAAMNVTVHAAETSTDRLLGEHLPRLLRTAGEVSAEWALWQSRPHVEVPRTAEVRGTA
ncbi:IclR family transcriptional regulator domain-containing protein [Modestobacter sp. SYSU DS0290]